MGVQLRNRPVRLIRAQITEGADTTASLAARITANESAIAALARAVAELGTQQTAGLQQFQANLAGGSYPTGTAVQNVASTGRGSRHTARSQAVRRYSGGQRWSQSG